jgi:hypothetical protein
VWIKDKGGRGGGGGGLVTFVVGSVGCNPAQTAEEEAGLVPH